MPIPHPLSRKGWGRPAVGCVLNAPIPTATSPLDNSGCGAIVGMGRCNRSRRTDSRLDEVGSRNRAARIHLKGHSMSDKASSPLGVCSFSIHIDDFRSHRIPGVPGAKLGSCYIRASELVNHLDLDDWLRVNPRVPNRNRAHILTGHVVRGIRETISDAPADFGLKNLGLFVLVAKIGEYDRRGDGGRLQLHLTDPEIHGLCNGGHTYAAIREHAEKAAEGGGSSTLDEVWVRLHLFEGIGPDKVAAMAEGLNRSKQVDDPSLMNLEGKFDTIREALDGKPGHDQISYHQGDSGSYYITEVIRAMMFFNCKRFDDRNHPSALYRQQKQMIKMFEEDCGSSPSPIDLIIPQIHEILALMDQLAKETPAAAKRLKDPFEIGRMSTGKRKGSPRAGSIEHKNTQLFFLNDVMDVKVPNGWLMVMLAAFRANIRWDLAKNCFEWKVPIDDLLPAVIDDLVRICVQEYRDNKAKPDEMARNPSVYEQCYDKVKLELHSRSAA